MRKQKNDGEFFFHPCGRLLKTRSNVILNRNNLVSVRAEKRGDIKMFSRGRAVGGVGGGGMV